MRAVEWTVAVGALFLLSNALDQALHSLSPAAGHLPLARAILIPAFAAAALLLVRARRQAVPAAAAGWPVLLVVGLAAASFLWSTDRAETVRWIGGLLGTTGVGLFLAVRFDRDEQLLAVCAALGIAAIASAIVLVGWPEFATRLTIRGGVWVGLFEENNLFGRAMSLCALASFVLAMTRRDWRAVGIAVGTLATLLLLGSRSLTGLLVASACLLAIGAMRYLRRDRPIRWRGALFAAALFGAALVAQGDITTGWERESSLTGRIPMWRVVLARARERPWLGHGYATFWPRAQELPRDASLPNKWPLRHPHNGFLHLFFELGLVGLLAFLVPFLFLLWSAFWQTWAGAPYWWPLAYLLFLALSNLTESGLLGHKIFWALYIAVAVSQCAGRDRAQPAGSTADRHTGTPAHPP